MYSRHRHSRSVQLVFCLLSLLMFVPLPIQRAHDFQVHYRTDPVRRTLEHHSELAQSAPGALDRAVKEACRPATVWWIEPEPAATPPAINEVVDHFPVPISRMLS